jgi:hypothetical protein
MRSVYVAQHELTPGQARDAFEQLFVDLMVRIRNREILERAGELYASQCACRNEAEKADCASEGTSEDGARR